MVRLASRAQKTRLSSSIVVRLVGTVTEDAPEVNHAEPWLIVDPRDASGRPLQLAGFTGRYLQGGETQGLAGLPGGKFLSVFVGGGRTMQLRSATIEISDGRRRR